MNAGKLTYAGGARILCELFQGPIYCDYQGGIPKIHLTFTVEKIFPLTLDNVEYISYSINCYGSTTISGINTGQVKGNTFFRMLSDDVKFTINLSQQQIYLIEHNRMTEDVHIDLNLNLLVSFNRNYKHTAELIEELPLTLKAQISKSDWIEKFLSKWEFFAHNETIYELPHILKFEKIEKYLVSARRAFSSNNYEEVIVICHKLLEALPREFGHNNPKNFFNALKTDTPPMLVGKISEIDELYARIKNFMHIARHDREED